ncbi:hypothetical protein JCM33374_g969 [Metschnikowia sp. JCM 33374]|nr:hypothetical protein JCM33374_g969 [Metschnikowia sp. JCM 33374]
MNWCLCPGTKAANVTKKVRSILLVKISMMMVHTSVSMEEGPSHLTDPVHPSDTPVSSGEVTIPTMNDSIDRVLIRP